MFPHFPEFRSGISHCHSWPPKNWIRDAKLAAEDWWGYGQDADRMNFTFNPEKSWRLISSPKVKLNSLIVEDIY